MKKKIQETLKKVKVKPRNCSSVLENYQYMKPEMDVFKILYSIILIPYIRQISEQSF